MLTYVNFQNIVLNPPPVSLVGEPLVSFIKEFAGFADWLRTNRRQQLAYLGAQIRAFPGKSSNIELSVARDAHKTEPCNGPFQSSTPQHPVRSKGSSSPFEPPIGFHPLPTPN